ncbi:hypothetical protein JYU34_015993 [Plutella xylostella]|uniref:Endonuclease n=1 Tax=Plutella xylostella TaxID=51655 RepID=A0ABQ7Q569_PLUXY|nr:hypothetical protein JYU34_015993 [Plutella xylostella]
MSSYADILQQQSEIVEKIKKININFKKDPKARKTADYHEERLHQLESYWKLFETNNTRLELTGQEKTGQYYEGRVFEKVQVLYNETRDLMLSSRRQLEQSLRMEKPKLQVDVEQAFASGSGVQEQNKSDPKEQTFGTPEVQFDKYNNFGGLSSETYDNNTQNMLNEHRSYIKAFERSIRNMNIEQITEKWQLEDKIRTISQRWENVDRMYWKLDNIIENMTTYEEEYNSLEIQYEQTKTAINQKIWAHHHQEKSAPKIELPIFSGHYSQWTTFKDLFMETVHCNSFISSAQKMQHLKSKLRGEAERLVQHLPISASNYETCWSILQQRYDNNRMLFAYHANELLNQPSIQQASSFQIKRMHDTTLENLNAITNLNIETSSWDPLLVHILLQKLDCETAQDFIESLNNPREIPKLSEFLGYLENKFAAMESSVKQGRNYQQKHNKSPPSIRKYSTDNKNNSNTQHSSYGSGQRAFHYAVAAITCPRCNKQHGLYNCSEFLNMTPNERRRTVVQLGICNNCLFSHHGKECTSKQKCKQCNRPHNTLLHEAMDSRNAVSSRGQRVSTHLWNDEQNEVLLATARIVVKSSTGSYYTLRALIDQGSQISLITEDAAQRLQLKREKLEAVISGIGASTSNKSKGMVNLSCKAIHSEYTFKTEALIMNTLTKKLPNKTIDRQIFKHLEHIQLADPKFNISDNIDMLLGADIYSEIVMEGLLKTNKSNIIAQQTHLGWIICGQHKSYQCHVTITNIEELAKFWEQEEIHDDSQQETENSCETFYNKTTTRLTDGRYQVRLPMKAGYQENIGTSKPQAVAQFKQLERRLRLNANFSQQYKEFMKEYQDMGHMIPSNRNNLEYFMPHHGVTRENAVTTKLRVVFNGSAKTSSKQSLNDLMEGGPNLQADMQTILLQWRQYRFVFTADIEKMYRFIAMHPEDQPLQKIVWRDSPNEPLQEFQLTSVAYGTRAAPYLALRTLKQLAEDDGNDFPKAKPVLLNNFFMDDAIFGEHSVSEARQTRNELIQLLERGGFNLRKWASNEPSLVKDLPDSQRNPRNFNFTEAQTSKTLGLGWDPNSDEFIFSPTITNKPTKTTTKRQVLSEISTLYDPLGWLSPITIKSKILFQKLWKLQLGWDSELPDETQREWSTLRTELANMHQFAIKRWLGYTENSEMELFAFCDSSEKAYACVVYSVTRDKPGEPQLNIVAAKTKVTPCKKPQTLPRLELCSAHLLAKLINKIEQSLKQQVKVTAWTDSMVVLGWLNGDVHRWNSYVSNRVQQILTVVSAEKWKHIKSEYNPADCASRGLLPSQLKGFTLWWKGPQCIFNTETTPNKQPETYKTNIEARVNIVAVQKQDINIITKLLNDSGTLTKAVRTLAQVLRFITIARGQQPRGKPLTLEQIRAARATILKQTQHEHYSQEINDLKNKNRVSQKSALLKLSPYLDKDQILRVGGRLNNSYLSEEAKHPAIIPPTSRLTSLLIDEAHITTLHGGARLTLTTLRQKYWIIGGVNKVKQNLQKCVKCIRYKNRTQAQLMGDLPRARTTPSPPFYHTGVDYTGHVDVKVNKGRGVKTSKGYIVIFVCMATKAVHLELASDLSTPTFLLALRRLINRRGNVGHLYSDCGSNFLGSDRILRKELKQTGTMNNDTCQEHYTQMGIQWHFNAPSWPNAGGIWESAVRMMKYHLKRVLGEQKLTYEEFLTLLTQIEACLNSRPLCPLTEDIENIECLTPGHFLIGRPIVSLPEENMQDEQISLRNRWKLLQQMHQQFWKKWSLDYLQELQQRSKWHRKTENISVGDVVLIKDDLQPPTRWTLGRVEEVHPGRDHLVRVVTLRTKGNRLIQRPINKLVFLPKTQQEEKVNEETETSRQQKQQKPQKKISSLLCVFITLLTLFQPATQANDFISVSQFKDNKPIYFDNLGQLQSIQDTWKIITYYNMTSYWLGVTNIKLLVDHVDNRCQEFAYNKICDAITTELKQEIEEIERNNYVLHSQHSMAPRRVPRGLIDGVGYVANTLFGVLDQRFAVQYKQDIEILQNNEHHLLKLIQNQTSIIEAHNNILQRNEETMNKQFQLIQEHLNITNHYIDELQNRINQEENMSYFNIVALSANIIITKIKNIQQMLLDTATNIHHGRIDARLISQEQLLQQLNTISTRIPKHLSLPVNDVQDQLVNIYKLLKVRWSIEENYFIIELSLPLTSDNQFNIYKPIPIPLIHNNKTFTVQSEIDYIAINMRKEIYMVLSDTDLSMCIKMDLLSLICNLNKPTLNMRNNDAPCEISLLTNVSTTSCSYTEEACTNKWIGLHRDNTWLYFCCTECLLRVICQDHMISRSTHSAGIIKADQGCVIKHGQATFYTKMFYQGRININPNIDVPTIEGDINNITIKQDPKHSPLKIEQRSNINDLIKIKNQIEKLKESSETTGEISTHDIHQYAVSYLALAGAAALAAAGACALAHRRRRRAVAPRPARPPTTNTDIEMTTFSSGATRQKQTYSIPNINFNI